MTNVYCRLHSFTGTENESEHCEECLTLREQIWKTKDDLKYRLAKQIHQRSASIAARQEAGLIEPQEALKEWEAILRLQQQFESIQLYHPNTQAKDYSLIDATPTQSEPTTMATQSLYIEIDQVYKCATCGRIVDLDTDAEWQFCCNKPMKMVVMYSLR